MTPLEITAYTMTTGLGAGKLANRQKLVAGISGLSPCRLVDPARLLTPVGEVDGLDEMSLPPELARFDCRNNRLAMHALLQDDFLTRARNLVARYGAKRVGVYIGTSTSGIQATEDAYRESNGFTQLPAWYIYEGTQNQFSAAAFCRALIGARGPAHSVSTACSSSAKVFASAARAIDCGLIDAALVGGVDSLCLTTLYGFHALQLIDSQPCRPFDRQRKGINVGEAGAFALLEKPARQPNLLLLGIGESSDAYHMSSPHPEGEGATAAMQAALRSASLAARDIDYINLHGTGTPANDLAEGKAVAALFGTGASCSSTKGFTGHTLGAAGIVEVGFSLLALEAQTCWQNIHLREPDPACLLRPLSVNQHRPLACVLTNSFGFGGSNCSLIVGSRQ